MEIDKFMKDDCNVRNVIIASSTQIGKTQYVIDTISRRIKECKSDIFVISCDNSLVQKYQMKSRLDLNGIKSVYVENWSVGENVIILLNNGSQIKKLNSALKSLKATKCFFFHDEADNINKSEGVDLVAVSQKEWDNLFLDFKIKFTRFWISATPENCSLISGINSSEVIVLKEDPGYHGVSGYIEWDGGGLIEVGNEIERIRIAKSEEVILYCVEKTNIGQESVAQEISEMFNCLTFNYNMKDPILYKDGRVLNGVIGSRDDISKILENVRGMGPVVVVGYLSMNRGISFVGIGINPPTATVMFYSGGVDSHLVGLTQRFGRITGNSRPDIDRRVIYCKESVYKDYCNYLSNQRVSYKSIENLSGTLDIVLKEAGGTLIKRNVDRPNLKSVNKAFREK